MRGPRPFAEIAIFKSRPHRAPPPLGLVRQGLFDDTQTHLKTPANDGSTIATLPARIPIWRPTTRIQHEARQEQVCVSARLVAGQFDRRRSPCGNHTSQTAALA